MSPGVDEAQVRHIAKLARLKLANAEVRLFAEQLTDILTYFKQIETVATDGVEPLSHPLPIASALRDDEPLPSLDSTQALANAPQREGRFFKVPKVFV